jgi:hypothetical protein
MRAWRNSAYCWFVYAHTRTPQWLVLLVRLLVETALTILDNQFLSPASEVSLGSSFLEVIFPASCNWCTAGRVQPEDVSHASCHCRATAHLPVCWRFPCHCCTVCSPSVSDGQSFLGSAVLPCRIICFLAAVLRGQFSVLTPFLLRFSDRNYFSVFYGYLFLLSRLRFRVQ